VNDEPDVPVVLCSARPDDHEDLARFFADSRWTLFAASSAEAALDLLRDTKAPILLSDRALLGPRWQEAVRAFVAARPHACVILLSEVSDPYLWDEVIHCGGFDVLGRPLRRAKVLSLLEFAYVHATTA
jgi:DNA-binding NtrC family response regulator